MNPRCGSPGDANPQRTHRRPRSPPTTRHLQAREDTAQDQHTAVPCRWWGWEDAPVAGRGPGRLHSCTVRGRLPAPLSRNHLNAPSDASLSGCHHGVTRPLGCHWRCLPGTGRPGCLGASRHSAGLIPHLMSHRGARPPVGIRPGPGGAPVGPQLLVQTGAPGGENMAGGMRLL